MAAPDPLPLPTVPDWPASDVPTTTGELLRVAIDGDDLAWRQLLCRFEPAVAATVARFRLQDADARDVAQQTWLQLLDHGQHIREPEALGAWLRTTARRECLRVVRRRTATDPLPPGDGLAYADPTCDVEQQVVDADTFRQLGRLVSRLPVRSRTLIGILFSDNPPSYAELSHRTGIPAGSIGPTRARALRRLRRMIERGPVDGDRDGQGESDGARDLVSTALA